MSTNYYRRNSSAGTYASSAPGQRSAGRTGSIRKTGGALYAPGPRFDPGVASVFVPQAPALGAFFPDTSFAAPGNVVQLFPGSGGIRKARRARLLGSEAGMATAEYANVCSS